MSSWENKHIDKEIEVMITKEVSIQRHIQQVLDGSHYKGYVKIADTKLDFELVFEVPIPHLQSMTLSNDENELRHFFQITVRRGDANIELTNKEYMFFFSMLVAFVRDFYHNPKIRSCNEGELGEMIHGKNSLATTVGALVAIGTSSSGACDLTPELCAMLSAPKFGCSLVD